MRLWQVFLLATFLGFVNLFDNPARQTFVLELVGRDDLPNAVSLNSVVMNSARVIGPAIGGALIALVGLPSASRSTPPPTWPSSSGSPSCDGRTSTRRCPWPGARVSSGRDSATCGGRRGCASPCCWWPWWGPWPTTSRSSWPSSPTTTFHGGAGVYSALTSFMGGGAVVGGLLIATRNKPNIHRLTAIGMAFGVLIVAVGLSPDLATALVLIFPMGAASIAFIATANATLQLRAEPSMRGRVMALYAIAFLGTTPIGSPLVGWISQVSSPRVALAVGGIGHHGGLVGHPPAPPAPAPGRADSRGRRSVAPSILDEAEPGTELGVA